jgi:hypothetical protein
MFIRLARVLRGIHGALARKDREICDLMDQKVGKGLPEAENKVRHAQPVWLLEGNPLGRWLRLLGVVKVLIYAWIDIENDEMKEDAMVQDALV